MFKTYLNHNLYVLIYHGSYDDEGKRELTHKNQEKIRKFEKVDKSHHAKQAERCDIQDKNTN